MVPVETGPLEVEQKVHDDEWAQPRLGPGGPVGLQRQTEILSGTNLDWARGPDDGPSCRLKVGPVGSKSYTDLDWAPAQLGSVPVEMGPLEAKQKVHEDEWAQPRLGPWGPVGLPC